MVKKMKKYKIVLLAVAIVSASFLGTLASTTDVDAANNECSSGYTQTTYMNKISYSISGNVVSYSGAAGLAYSTSFDGTIYPIDSTGTFTFTIPSNQMNSRIEVYFYLQQDDGVCAAKDENGNYQEIGSNTFYANTSGRNQLYDNALCVNYRSKWSNNKTMREAVPYCFTETVSVQYSYNDVSNWITEAERLYNIRNNGSTNIVQDPSYTNVDDVKNTEKLVCDAFSTNNYETMHKYSHIDTVTVDNCTTTCKEEIEVNFSDPVATQAGMCFQYLIEIKSRVVCDGVYTAPKPSPPAVCVPTAECFTSSGYESDKGGPSEDFDACVLECDGGDYSQSCINKCYEEVYGTSSAQKKVKTQTTFSEIPSILTFNSYIYNGEQRASQLANGCINEDSSLTEADAEALYNQKLQYPGGHYEGDRWVPSGTCPSNISYFYFTSLDKTRTTITELNGTYHDSHGYKKYEASTDSNGFIIRTERNGYSSVCNDTCSWVNECDSDSVLNEYLANEQYQKELAEWESKNQTCQQKAATCSNETTKYEIVVDNVDNDNKSDDDQESFTSSQKLNSSTVTGDFPSMVILTDGKCEDGRPDDWDYHNIITFPGTWINNKTGQTVHSMDPDHEDFYTNIGNQYCTKINSIPVNTAWYNWKVNKDGDPNALTDSQKQQIAANIDMNINGHIDNYGYFGWNFDISCFYALDEPEPGTGKTSTGTCSEDDPDYPRCISPDDPDYPIGEPPEEYDYSPVNDYTFRPISLDNIFPNSATPTSNSAKDIQASQLINEVESMKNNKAAQVANETREVGFNWTCAATNLENPDYPVQPVSVLNEIQRLGDSIYDDSRYLDYHIVLTPADMNKVREYNSHYNSYLEPTSPNSNLGAGNNKTAGITVYKSYLLHKVINSAVKKSGLIGCNNEDNGSCPNTIDTSTACYNEYMAQSSVLKGAN